MHSTYSSWGIIIHLPKVAGFKVNFKVEILFLSIHLRGHHSLIHAVHAANVRHWWDGSMYRRNKRAINVQRAGLGCICQVGNLELMLCLRDFCSWLLPKQLVINWLANGSGLISIGCIGWACALRLGLINGAIEFRVVFHYFLEEQVTCKN